MGSTIKVLVSFTDGANNDEDPLESDATAVVPVSVTIASNRDSIGAGVEELVFTLTRQGPTTAPLAATVDIVQAELWLKNSEGSHTVSYPVTFPAGKDTVDLEFAPDQVSLDPETGGNLTATVSGTGIAGGEAKTVEIVSLAYPPITISFDKDAYTFAEGAEPEDVNVYVVATLDPAYPRAPTRDLSLPFFTDADTATLDQDYESVRWGFEHRFRGLPVCGRQFRGPQAPSRSQPRGRRCLRGLRTLLRVNQPFWKHYKGSGAVRIPRWKDMRAGFG